MNKQKIVITILILGAIYLSFHIFVLIGVLKERAEKECVGASAISKWEETISMAQSICVDVQKNQLDTIKNNYNSQMSECEKDRKYWKDSYFWLKSEQNKQDE